AMLMVPHPLPRWVPLGARLLLGLLVLDPQEFLQHVLRVLVQAVALVGVVGVGHRPPRVRPLRLGSPSSLRRQNGSPQLQEEQDQLPVALLYELSRLADDQLRRTQHPWRPAVRPLPGA